MLDEPIRKISFRAPGRNYEVYTRSVGQSSMLGFVEVEGILFGERSQVVVDPSEETLKTEFKGVRRTFIPMHAVVRIDQVDKQGQPRITEADTESEGTLMPFPSPVIGAPGKDPGKS